MQRRDRVHEGEDVKHGKSRHNPALRVREASGGFQCFQIDLAVLTRERHFSPLAALVLLHAGDAMVASVINFDFAIACIDGQPFLIAEECVARFVLIPG